MNLTAQQAALAWAQGKRVEAKAATHPDFLSVAPVGTDNGCWSGRVFGEGHENYDFRLAPGETMEEATVSEQATPVDDGGLLADACNRAAQILASALLAELRGKR